jgi:hypothetical protein
VFISAEGNRPGRLDPDWKEIDKAIEARAKIVVDNEANRNRSYNLGERQVREYLSDNGYYVEEENDKYAVYVRYSHETPNTATSKAPEVTAPRIGEQAKSVYDSAVKYDKLVTPMLKDMQERGVELIGLEYRIKGLDRLVEKLQQDKDSPIKDALRYTYMLNEDGFGEHVAAIITKLQDSGLECVRIRNTFNDVKNYRGVNTLFKLEDGFIFELQFHTQASFDAKQKAHELYEELRVSNDANKIRKLGDQMGEIFASIPMPEYVDLIISYDNLYADENKE